MGKSLDLSIGVISLGNVHGGSYSTVLPISSPEYRADHPTKASLAYKKEGDIHIFEITDDWGTLYILKIEDASANMPFVEKNKAYKV